MNPNCAPQRKAALGSQTKSLASWVRRGNGPSAPIKNVLLGVADDCYQLGRRVTSATCADGCATAASGANRKTISQGLGRRIPPPCNQSFPSPQLLRATLTGSPISQRSSPRLKQNPRSPRTSRSQPLRRVKARGLHSRCGATAVAAVDDVAGEAGEADHSRLRKPPPCLALVVRPEKRAKPKSRRKPASPRPLLPLRLVHQRRTRPGSRRAR